MKFSFGQSEYERIEVKILGYERAPVGEYWDDNWLTVVIYVHAGGFHGKAEAAIVTSELMKFVQELQSLHSTLNGSAEFTTLEDQLRLRLTGDGKGRIELSGEVSDAPGVGNRLHFQLDFDQSQLGASLHELQTATENFPPRV